VKLTQPLPPVGQRVLLFFYGILSGIYRIFVGVLIILTVMYSIPVLGPLMALGGMITWLVVPVVKLTKYLTIEPELHRKRGLAIAFTLACLLLIGGVIGLIKVPVHVTAEGIVKPKERQVLYARTPGFINEIHARDGQRLKKGDVILTAESRELDAKIAQLTETVAAARARVRGANVNGQPLQAQSYEQDLRAYNDELAVNLRHKEELTVRAPIDGYLVAPDLTHLIGKFMPEGTEICTVQETDTLEIAGSVEQGDVQLISHADSPKTLVRLVSRFDQVMQASNLRVFDEATEQLPHESLGVMGGGTAPSDPKDESGRKTGIPQFELRAEIANPDSTFVPGQRAYLKATVDRRPLLWHWYRAYEQVRQARSQSSKWK